MWGDCHIHMILDGVDYRAAFDRHRDQPDDALIHARLADYRERGVAFLRDGGDRWGVGLRAKALAGEYGIDYRSPAFNICRAGHYGAFLGRTFADLSEYRALVAEVKALGGDFIKVMASGLMDFHQLGSLTDTPCDAALMRDLVSIAHDAGFPVMVHANGPEAVSASLAAGADSIEHGAYLLPETLRQLAESKAVWVPTLVTIGNLRGLGRFPDQVLCPLLELQQQNVATAAVWGAAIALGTVAGAYAVYHGAAVAQEYELLREALGAETDAVLARGEAQLRAWPRASEHWGETGRRGENTFSTH